MKKVRYGLLLAWILLASVTVAEAQISIGIGLPNVSIGINLPVYPELVRVPGYPVYYAPQVTANYFFYDGLYWVFQNDNWYASSWYNGPWGVVSPEVVPVFILRIPVRYYRQPPAYFHGWKPNAPPRWSQHWGHEWEQHRKGWDKWKKSSAPAPAPLPAYQKRYTRDRYPLVEQQTPLHKQYYRYQPHDRIVRQHYQQSGSQPDQHGAERHQTHPPQAVPHQRGQTPHEQKHREPAAHMHDQRPQERGEAPEHGKGHGHGEDRNDERGKGRDK